MRKEYQTPEIEIIEFDMDVQMMMTLSNTGDSELNNGDNDLDSGETGWAD